MEMNHPVVSREQWLAARQALLAREKAWTRMGDDIRRARQQLPWVKVEKRYIFQSPQGPQTLAELFEGRSQLIVNHFMFGPGWQEGCVGCSFAADHIDSVLPHLQQRDVTLVTVSRAPLEDILPFQRRMGWRFKWVSSYGNDFNYDYHVSATPEATAQGRFYYNYRDDPLQSEEMSGASVFYRDAAGHIFHTYSNYARGGEPQLTTYSYLDLVPKGRDENGPTYSLADWVRHHDKYDEGGSVAPSGRYIAPGQGPACCAKPGA